jgi:uncharacterized protein (DUF433 family)
VEEAMNVIGNGIYDIREAARLTGLKQRRVREWFRGRVSDPMPHPVFRSDYEGLAGNDTISFLDLVEVFIAGQLRGHGVSLQYIRRAHKRLKVDWATPHPFAIRQIRTDGKQIFAALGDEPEWQTIYEVVSRNQVFESIILPALAKVEYDAASNLAMKWHLTDFVVLDPRVCFGKPVVEAVSITTYALAASYFGHGQNAKAVADWYEIKEQYVMAAVEFEARFAARTSSSIT